ncbi:MAG: alpha/beta fold hydrolase [Anaerolineales bacterium]|nr:alpha/beta fold hydrolase [Anaerolineales bacterium]
MPVLNLPDLSLYYETHGSPAAPALLLLHGLGSSADDWQLQAPVFSRRYDVITVDLRGHGRSVGAGATAGSSRPFTIEQMADDAAALLDHLQVAAAYVVGLSLGGCVAQALAVRYPARVRALVLVNTFARLRPAGWRGAGRLLKRAWLFAFAPMPALAAFIARGLFPKPEQRPYYEAAVARLSQNTKGPYLAAMRAVARFDLRRQLAAVRCPALVVAGDRDQTVPLAAAQALHRAIPGARFALLADSGHASPYDQTENFNEVVLAFLAEQAPQ